MSKQQSIAAIDLSAIFRMHWHAGEKDGVNAAYSKTLDQIHGIASGHAHVAVCVDRPPYKRREIDPQYKAHREKQPESMHEQLRQVIEELGARGIHILGAQGYEADDVIATVCRWAFQQQPAREVMVYTSDKDLMQLVGPTVTVISTATGEVYDSAAVRAKFGVEPARIPDLLALMGDSSDGIGGIKGVGPKTAAPWVTEYSTVEGVIANAAKLEPQRFREVVAGSADALLRNLKLTKLSYDVPCNPEVILTEKPKAESKPADGEAPGDLDADFAPVPETQAEKPSQAIAVIPTVTAEVVPWNKSLEPTTPQSAWGIAKMLYKSRAFGDWPNAEAIMAVVMTGRSFGLDAVASLRGFHNIKGRLSPSAQTLIGLVKRATVCEFFMLLRSDDHGAEWETKRVGEPGTTKMSYTMDDARMAGLAGNDQWKKRPKVMLRWRAATELARVVYPDIVSGLYSADEIEEAT